MRYFMLMVLLVGCSSGPQKRNYTSIDRTEDCMLRLVEKNGVSPTEAENVCTRIHRFNIHQHNIDKSEE